MAKWIILIMQHEEALNPVMNEWKDICDIAVCGGVLEDELMIFDSLDEAAYYRDEHTIDGQIIELPTY